MNNKHGLLVVDQELFERDVKIACKARYPVYPVLDFRYLCFCVLCVVYYYTFFASSSGIDRVLSSSIRITLATASAAILQLLYGYVAKGDARVGVMILHSYVAFQLPAACKFGHFFLIENYGIPVAYCMYLEVVPAAWRP
jgi:hypothetical protein